MSATKTHKAYRLATTLKFYNGERYESLVEAVKQAKQLLEIHPHRTIDVMEDIDRDTARVVWTCDSATQGFNRPKNL